MQFNDFMLREIRAELECRRLHDIGRSGWFLLLALIPVIGALLLIYWLCQPGTPGPNTYGNPVAYAP